MPLPTTDEAPPFTITRLSHVVLNVVDLAASRIFYEDLIGLVVSDSDDELVYLRGVEETSHHSLVLRAADSPSAERIGLRVASDGDLDAAERSFTERGLPTAWVEVPHQGPTLQVADVAGVPVELCASMPVMPRLVLDESRHRGAAAARIDHLQLHLSNLLDWVSFYTGNGFRISEFVTNDGSADDPLLGAFLSRKGDLLDLVGVAAPGPRLHHFAFVVHNHASTLTRTCDLASAMGMREAVEFGPARHGLAPQHFLYLRDPDGHRVELVSHGYQLLDPEVEPVGWSITDPRVVTTWGGKPGRSWLEEASPFAGVTIFPPPVEDGAAVASAAVEDER